MKRYVITNTILSRAEGATPADVTWYQGEDKGEAMAALLQAMNHGDDKHGNLPESMRFDVVSVKCDVFEVPTPDALTYDVEWPEDGYDGSIGLDSCCWYDNKYQPWTRIDCSGRMAVVSMRLNGNLQTAAMICEAHVNAYPDNF